MGQLARWHAASWDCPVAHATATGCPPCHAAWRPQAWAAEPPPLLLHSAARAHMLSAAVPAYCAARGPAPRPALFV